MITPDFIHPLLAIPAAVVATTWWLILEYRNAPLIGPDHHEAVTGMDVLERTGVHPGEVR